MTTFSWYRKTQVEQSFQKSFPPAFSNMMAYWGEKGVLGGRVLHFHHLSEEKPHLTWARGLSQSFAFDLVL